MRARDYGNMVEDSTHHSSAGWLIPKSKQMWQFGINIVWKPCIFEGNSLSLWTFVECRHNMRVLLSVSTYFWSLQRFFSNVDWNTNFYTFLGDFQGNFFSATYFWSSPSCKDFLQRNVEIILHTAQTTFALAWLVQGEYNGGRLVGRLHNFPII